MDKAEAMWYDACIPESWWEYSVKYAVHLYNRSSLCCLNWHIPYELVNKNKPDITYLWVFGCGAYVYLPETIQYNTLTHKSELMTFLGIKESTKGYLFMRTESVVEFTTTTALFDKKLFSRCLNSKQPEHTSIKEIQEDLAESTVCNAPQEIEDLPFLLEKPSKTNEWIHFDKSRHAKQALGDSIDSSGICSPTPQPNYKTVEQQGTLPVSECAKRPQWVRNPIRWPGNIWGSSKPCRYWKTCQ